MNKQLAFLIRSLLSPFLLICYVAELALTPAECRVGIRGWVRLWLTGDCAIPCNCE